MDPLVVAGISALGIGSVAVAWSLFKDILRWTARKRTAELAALAASFGFQFEPTGFSKDAVGFGHLEFFRRGQLISSKNMLSAERDGNMVRMFDYEYFLPSRRGPLGCRPTICTLEVPVELPRFWICPENEVTRAVARAGLDDINFPEAPEFSAKYCIRAADQEFARRLVDERMRDFLLRAGDANVEMGRKAILFHLGKKLPPREFPRLCALALEFLSLVSEKCK
ncbi:MAG: hypothetical protein RDV41_05135 [Planctomycetota bacterium]|nr:hypothetical protein [Planctomycetota bacterium]